MAESGFSSIPKYTAFSTSFFLPPTKGANRVPNIFLSSKYYLQSWFMHYQKRASAKWLRGKKKNKKKITSQGIRKRRFNSAVLDRLLEAQPHLKLSSLYFAGLVPSNPTGNVLLKMVLNLAPRETSAGSVLRFLCQNPHEEADTYRIDRGSFVFSELHISHIK